MSNMVSRINAALACTTNGFARLYSVSTVEDLAGVRSAIGNYGALAGTVDPSNYWFGAELIESTWINPDQTTFLASETPSSNDPTAPCMAAASVGGTLTFGGSDCTVTKIVICEWPTTVSTTTTSNFFI